MPVRRTVLCISSPSAVQNTRSRARAASRSPTPLMHSDAGEHLFHHADGGHVHGDVQARDGLAQRAEAVADPTSFQWRPTP